MKLHIYQNIYSKHIPKKIEQKYSPTEHKNEMDVAVFIRFPSFLCYGVTKFLNAVSLTPFFP